jgi:hypothetical protein
MKPVKTIKTLTAVAALVPALGMMATGSAQITTTDTFGSGANTFTIDFVTVGNAGNGNDAGAGGGSYSSPYGGVDYVYRISTYAISQNDIATATAAGLANVTAGAWTGDRPAANISWYEAAAFVNWLNTSNGHQAAYNLTFDSDSGWSMTLWSSEEAWQLGGENLYRHKDAYYFLPSEDEWYKAAFHQNDGVTANYWDYATGSNTAPTPVAGGTASGTAVYNGQSGPADVHLAGGLSPYGTMGQNGNVWEWSESAFDGINNSSSESRAIRGGFWANPESLLRSSSRGINGPAFEGNNIGFRVASVPEPSVALLVLMAGGAWLLRRRSKHSL